MVLAKPLSRILYVDDDASMRELVRTALAAQPDFSVVTCASGFEALIIVGQLRPDLILMDVAMPRMDGVQTLECLRAMELGHHTPVVFVAAGLAPLELRRLQAAGAAEVIRLPFDAGRLPELIRSIWSRIAD
jgi:CheY-like chemotaxis protein